MEQTSQIRRKEKSDNRFLGINIQNWKKAEKKRTYQQINEAAGLNKGEISKYINNHQDIGDEALRKVADFLGVEESQLINEKISWDKFLKVSQKTTSTHNSKSSQQYEIPLIPIDAVAGFSEDTLKVVKSDIEDYYSIPTFRKVDFLIRVAGNSMFPKYQAGDMVACKHINESSFIQWNKVYVLDTEQGALVKRITKSKQESCFTLVSDNAEEYPPFEIPKKEIRSMSIIVGLIRSEV